MDLGFTALDEQHAEERRDGEDGADDHDEVVIVAKHLDDHAVHRGTEDGSQGGKEIIQTGESADVFLIGHIHHHGQGIDVDQRPGDPGEHHDRADHGYGAEDGKAE